MKKGAGVQSKRLEKTSALFQHPGAKQKKIERLKKGASVNELKLLKI